MPVTRHPLASDSRQIRAVPVDEAVIKRLEESLGFMLAQPGLDLASEFYQTLFARHPEVRPMFPQDMTAQKKKLTDALSMVVANLRAPQTVFPRLRELGHNHIAYGTRQEHYPLVCASIVSAMAKVSGGQWNRDLETEWRTALELVSLIMQQGAEAKP